SRDGRAPPVRIGSWRAGGGSTGDRTVKFRLRGGLRVEGLQRGVRVLDGALGGGVASGRLGGVVLRRPRRRLGELGFDDGERSLRLLDRVLEALLLAEAVLGRADGPRRRRLARRALDRPAVRPPRFGAPRGGHPGLRRRGRDGRLAAGLALLADARVLG